MDDISKMLSDINNRIKGIEVKSVENLKYILENTDKIKKLIDDIIKAQWKELIVYGYLPKNCSRDT